MRKIGERHKAGAFPALKIDNPSRVVGLFSRWSKIMIQNKTKYSSESFNVKIAN